MARVRSASSSDRRVRQIADRVVNEHPEAMDILANHRPEDETPPA
jgi:hypothetical protein